MYAQLICKNDTRSLQAADSFSWYCAYLKTLFFIIVELVGMKWVELNLLKDGFFSIDSSGLAPSRVLLQNIYSDRVSVQLYYRINPKLLVCFTYKRDFPCKTFLKRCAKQKKRSSFVTVAFHFRRNVQNYSPIHVLSVFVLNLRKRSEWIFS